MKEDAISDPTRLYPSEESAPSDDPDTGSTWSTIDGTAEVDELLNDEDLDTFLVEPIPDPRADPLA